MSNDKFKDSVIEYFKKYYDQRKKTPPARQIFKHFSKAKFYQTFSKGIMEACELAEIPVPEARIKRTERAVQASKKKRFAEATKQATPWEDLKQSYKREEDERRLRKQMSEELAKQVRKLATDPNKEIRGPVLDALEKVLPIILKRCYGITLSFWGLQKLNEITGGDLSYETVTKMVQYAKLTEEERQAIHDLLGKLDGMTLFEIAKYAKLSPKEKEAVRALLGYSMKMRMSPMEVIVFLDLERRIKEKGVRGFLGEFGDEKEGK